jgi:SWI/SNF-related matrix-associated actin-dependent regulator of chromatin subfamily A3
MSTLSLLTSSVGMFEPEETGGGILADEMGMGKTLCVLALTLESLSVAQDWVVQNTATGNEPPEGWRCRPRCKATLIVASSDRSYPKAFLRSGNITLTPLL